MREPIYAEFQQVITFIDEKPRIAWVSAMHRRRATVWTFEGRTEVHVSHYEDERDAGIGSWVSVRKVQPYTPELWAACERWMQRREALGDDFRKLSAGRLVDAQMAMSI